MDAAATNINCDAKLSQALHGPGGKTALRDYSQGGVEHHASAKKQEQDEETQQTMQGPGKTKIGLARAAIGEWNLGGTPCLFVQGAALGQHKHA